MMTWLMVLAAWLIAGTFVAVTIGRAAKINDGLD